MNIISMYIYVFFAIFVVVMLLVLLPIYIFFFIRESLILSKNSKIDNSENLTGYEVARKMLLGEGIRDFNIREYLGYHLWPSIDINFSGKYNKKYFRASCILRKNEIRLSEDVYSGKNISAVAISAYEACLLIQYNQGNLLAKMRNLIYKIEFIGALLFIPLVLVEFIVMRQQNQVFSLIIIMFLNIIIAFDILAFALEIAYNRRNISILERSEVLYGEDLKRAKKVINAASYSYLISMFVEIIYLLIKISSIIDKFKENK